MLREFPFYSSSLSEASASTAVGLVLSVAYPFCCSSSASSLPRSAGFVSSVFAHIVIIGSWDIVSSGAYFSST